MKIDAVKLERLVSFRLWQIGSDNLYHTADVGLLQTEPGAGPAAPSGVTVRTLQCCRRRHLYAPRPCSGKNE